MPTGSRRQKMQARRPAPFPIFLALFALLIIAGGLLRLFGSVAERAAAPVGGAFRLLSSKGGIVTEKSFPGKYLLIYFGYTSCPDICPTALAGIARAMARLGPRAAEVQALFITIDPARDTPALLRRYVAQFSPAIIGLTGSVAEIAQVEKEYHVSVSVPPSQTGKSNPGIDHTAALYLMAPDGRFVTAFRPDESGTDIAASIGKIVS
ncbi:MAG TPA: SCO family protein [Acetobacteraceae bacterium]|jgi:protein SCO1/2|nr:SCO family protein [Acetobacteraceae bacterium]